MRQRRAPSGPTIVLQTEENTVSNGNSGADFTIDWSLGPNQQLVLTAASVVIRQEGLPTGETAELTLTLFQDATGNRVAHFADCQTPGGATLTLSTAANKKDLLDLHWDGHVLQATVRGLAFA